MTSIAMGVRASVEWTCWAVTMTSPSSGTPWVAGAASGSATATAGRTPAAISHRPRQSGHEFPSLWGKAKYWMPRVRGSAGRPDRPALSRPRPLAQDVLDRQGPPPCAQRLSSRDLPDKVFGGHREVL